MGRESVVVDSSSVLGSRGTLDADGKTWPFREKSESSRPKSSSSP